MVFVKNTPTAGVTALFLVVFQKRSYPVRGCLCWLKFEPDYPTSPMLLHLFRFWKLVEGFIPTAVYFTVCSSETGSVRAQQSSKHFMQSPISGAPSQMLQTGLGIWGFICTILEQGWCLNLFTSELSLLTCWKCLDLIKHVIAHLRRTKFRIQLMQDPKPVPANYFFLHIFHTSWICLMFRADCWDFKNAKIKGLLIICPQE